MFFVMGAMALLVLSPREHLRGGLDPGPAYAIERQLLELRGAEPQQARQLHSYADHLYGDAGRYAEAARHF